MASPNTGYWIPISSKKEPIPIPTGKLHVELVIENPQLFHASITPEIIKKLYEQYREPFSYLEGKAANRIEEFVLNAGWLRFRPTTDYISVILEAVRTMSQSQKDALHYFFTSHQEFYGSKKVRVLNFQGQKITEIPVSYMRDFEKFDKVAKLKNRFAKLEKKYADIRKKK